MNSTRLLISRPLKTVQFLEQNWNSSPNIKRVPCFRPLGARVRCPLAITKCSSTADIPLAAEATASSSSSISSAVASQNEKLEAMEENIEKVIYRCRFFAFLAVMGSLVGSFLCFIKGCTYVVSSYTEYLINRGKVIMLLVEAIDVYLLGTVMLVFGMGLYELFISNLDPSKSVLGEKVLHRSNLFGLFTLKERPRWLAINSVNELKTKLGHVIVMLLLIGFFEKSKMAAIHSPMDLLCLSASVLLCSGCLYLLSKLNGSK